MMRSFLKPFFAFVFVSWCLGGSLLSAEEPRPNILMAMADDWGWPHAGSFNDPVVVTPTFDSLAKEGVLFTRAFVSSPSCTPSRGALMTGQYHWRLEEGANLHGTLNKKFRSYSEILADAGYEIGHSGKAWGPGRIEVGGRTNDPTGPLFGSFAEFMQKRDPDKPFCFWLGSIDPHRPYEKGSGRAGGIDVDKVHVPGFYPNVDEVRSDIADYYWEVQRFDHFVGDALAQLDKAGLSDNTIVVMTGDHGMPFPRSKGNLYDIGVRVPLAIRWPARIKPERTDDDFVSFVDLAPTFLAAAGLTPPADMSGHSLLPILTGDQAGRVEPGRDHVIFGKERHVTAQEKGNMAGYPSRGLRNERYLYIMNLRPELGPVGIASAADSQIGNSFGDTDNGPTKSYLLAHRDDPQVQRYFALSFGLRPAEELYDCEKDPDQLTNVADDPAYAEIKKQLAEQLVAELRASADPRIVGGGEKFESYPYYGHPQKPADTQK